MSIKVTNDFGHGGTDPGAIGFVVEKDGALRCGKALSAALIRNNFAVKETRSSDVFVTLDERVRISDAFGSDWFISNHENAGGGHGITVYCYKFGGKGEILANEVLKELVAATGMPSLGVKEGNFQVIRNTKAPAILIEFGFVDNAVDAKIISRSDIPDIYGDAVTRALCAVCGVPFVPKEGTILALPLPQEVGPKVLGQGHVQDIGWQNITVDTIGTVGLSKRLEAIRLELANALGSHLKYTVHVQDLGWMDTVQDGAFAGTQGKSLRIEAVKIWLEGLDGYVLQYRGHVENTGWQGWVNSGEVAGTTGQSLRLEALQVRLVKKP